MSRLSIDERFAQFEEDAVPTFKAEVDQVYTGVRKLRRKRRLRFAVAAAIIVAIPATWFGVSKLPKDEPPAPVATSPVRKVNVPGVTILDRPTVQFISADAGFAVYNQCRANEDPECRHELGVTTDRGQSWHAVKLPDMPGNYEFQIFAIDASVFAVDGHAVYTNDKTWNTWITRDGGKTYTTPPDKKIPDEFKYAGYGLFTEYEVECLGVQVRDAQGIPVKPEQYVPDPSGCTTTLARLGSGPLTPQPPDLGLTPRVISGKDGRVWLTSGVPQNETRLRMSNDAGKTWQEMPEIPAGAWIHLSPDGTEAYYILRPRQVNTLTLEGPAEIARLEGGKWVRVFSLEKQMFDAVAIGDGALFVGVYSPDHQVTEFFYVKGGVRTYPPQIGEPLSFRGMLNDGTVLLEAEYRGFYLGTGYGINREWTFITY